MLARVEAGHFNAIFVESFVYGRANYRSDFLEKSVGLAPNFDPLAYIIKQAHPRGIQVHAWLVAGPVGGLEGPILSQHPDWAMVSLDGERANWLNYSRPDVRQFISSVALEIIENYKVDGIHFDYTRYPSPGWKWGFDPSSTQLFAQKTGLDADTMRYSALPAYGSFQGNPLVEPNTAQVLAEFTNGRPAIMLNKYGQGEVVIFNWEADERQIAASSEILRRSLTYLRGKSGQIYLLRSETNAKEYGLGDFNRVMTWLKDIQQSPLELAETDLGKLNADDVLVMPSVYLIDAPTAAKLADLVRQGLGMVFVDGPTRSINNQDIQAITGMSSRSRSFHQETDLLVAVAEHPILPTRNDSADIKQYQDWAARWKDFREQGINTLLKGVYPRLKRAVPHVLVTITVAANQETLANKHFLDWRAWYTGQYVDLIIPRAYVNEDEALAPVIAAWRPALNNSDRIMLGLSVYAQTGGKEGKNQAGLLSEISQACSSGSKGIILFDLEGINESTLRALAKGPFLN
jgi:uncharacterized lipoprotein YddW (UPF0748 family)